MKVEVYFNPISMGSKTVTLDHFPKGFATVKNFKNEFWKSKVIADKLSKQGVDKSSITSVMIYSVQLGAPLTMKASPSTVSYDEDQATDHSRAHYKRSPTATPFEKAEPSTLQENQAPTAR